MSPLPGTRPRYPAARGARRRTLAMRVHALRASGGLATAIVLFTGFVFVGTRGGAAQTRFAYTKGQSVTPAFEGWWPNEDGSFTLFFGYFNTNWQEELDVPIGPANAIEPGGPDQ